MVTKDLRLSAFNSRNLILTVLEARSLRVKLGYLWGPCPWLAGGHTVFPLWVHTPGRCVCPDFSSYRASDWMKVHSNSIIWISCNLIISIKISSPNPPTLWGSGVKTSTVHFGETLFSPQYALNLLWSTYWVTLKNSVVFTVWHSQWYVYVACNCVCVWGERERWFLPFSGKGRHIQIYFI